MSTKRKSQGENVPPSGSHVEKRAKVEHAVLKEGKLPNIIKSYIKANEAEREVLRANAYFTVSFTDPYLTIRWHDANIARAALEGPLDSAGNQNPRTVAHLENFLEEQQPGAVEYDTFSLSLTWNRRVGGLLQFVNLADVMNAIHKNDAPLPVGGCRSSPASRRT